MIKVNLLSPEKKDAGGSQGPDSQSFQDTPAEQKINNAAIIGALLICLGIGGYMFWTQQQAIDTLQKQLAEKKAEKLRLKTVEETLKELEKTRDMLNRKVQLIGELKSKKLSAVKMMDAVSSSLPEWVWLSRLSFKDDNLSLVGNAIHNNLIADFINNLRATNNFENIHFQSSTLSKRGGMDVFSFTLTCTFKGKAIGGKVK